jgi:hypothetical protein
MLEVNLKDLQEFTSNKSKIELYEKLVEASKNQEKDSQKKLDDIIKKIDQLQKEIDGTLKAFKITDITELKKIESKIYLDIVFKEWYGVAQSVIK